VLSQGNTARRGTLVQKACTSGNRVNKNKSKTIGKRAEVVKNHFTSASMKDWCMSQHGITGPRTKIQRNSGNKFPLARPLTRPNFVTLRQKVRDIRCGKILLPGKVGQSSPWSPDLSPIDRPYTSFYRHFVVILVLDCFVSEIYWWFCIANATFVHTPALSSKIWKRFPKVRSMSSVVQ